MKDPEFIDSLVARGKDAQVKAIALFSGISSEQFNRQPAPGSWSAAQCLEHLVISDSAYFKTFEELKLATYKMNFWARINPLSGIFGASLRKSLDVNNTKKYKTAPKLKPTANPHELAYIQTYRDTIARFLAYVEDCRYIELDKIIITSPVLGLITYSLRDMLAFLIEHEHRHLNQAERALASPA